MDLLFLLSVYLTLGLQELHRVPFHSQEEFTIRDLVFLSESEKVLIGCLEVFFGDYVRSTVDLIISRYGGFRHKSNRPFLPSALFAVKCDDARGFSGHCLYNFSV